MLFFPLFSGFYRFEVVQTLLQQQYDFKLKDTGILLREWIQQEHSGVTFLFFRRRRRPDHMRKPYLEHHPRGCKWPKTMVNKFPRVVPLPSGHSWFWMRVTNHLPTFMILQIPASKIPQSPYSRNKHFPRFMDLLRFSVRMLCF